MKKFAVYRLNGTLFAEFGSMSEMCRILRVRSEDVFDCLNGHMPKAFTRKTLYRKHKAFTFRESDSSTTGVC